MLTLIPADLAQRALQLRLMPGVAVNEMVAQKFGRLEGRIREAGR